MSIHMTTTEADVAKCLRFLEQAFNAKVHYSSAMGMRIAAMDDWSCVASVNRLHENKFVFSFHSLGVSSGQSLRACVE